MADKFVTASLSELGAGIDTLSPETKVPEGYSEELVNFEPTPEGSLKKRVGYQLHSGAVPVRVEEVTYSGTTISFLLDTSIDVSSIDLTRTVSSPVFIYGRTANAHADGDFTNEDRGVWYSGFSSDPKVTLSVGSGILNFPGATHGQGSLLSFALSLSTSTVSNSNSLVSVDQVLVDKLSGDITVYYTNGTGTAQRAFAYMKSRATVSGQSYVHTPVAVGPGSTTTTISTGTHGLSNFNILCEAYIDDGSTYTKVQPDAITIDGSGTVSISVTSVTSVDVVYILYCAPVANFATGSVASGASLNVPVSLEDGTDFIYPVVYLEDLVTGDLAQVMADTVSVDADARTATFSFVNGTSSSANFNIYYDFGFVTSNRLSVTGSTITSPFTGEACQLTIWGLLHSEIYVNSSAVTRPGWVNHLDSYRSEAEERLVCGLGGNIFASYTRDEVGDTYGMPLLFPATTNRVDADTTIAPAFRELGSGSQRSRGFVEFTGGSAGWARVTSVTWQSGNTVRYTLSCPSMVVNGTLSSIISTDDRLSVQNCGWSRHNGTFKIVARSVGTDELYLDVENSLVSSADYDLTGLSGRAGVFTDIVPMTNTHLFIPGDTLLSALWGEEESYVVVPNTHDHWVLVSGVEDELSIPDGLRVQARRTSSVIPLMETDGDRSVEGFVRGDSATYSAVARSLRLKQVRTSIDSPMTVTGDGTTATVEVFGITTENLNEGQSIVLMHAGEFSGEYIISSVTGSTTFTFLSEKVGNVSGTLLGNCIEVDEQLTWESDGPQENTFSIERRWIPIEAPDDDSYATPNYHFRYFTTDDYANQSFIRSTISKDSLFLTNRKDAVQKFDGASIYRAGLPRHQLLTYVTADSTAGAKVEVNFPSVTPSAVSANRFEVTLGEEQNFAPNDRIRHSFSGGYTDYVVSRITSTATKGYVEVVAYSTITLGTSPSLRRIGSRRYYARLNAIDANGNVVASATAGSEDYRINLGASAAVYHKLQVPPAWDNYDFARIEAQIYGTKLNEEAPFYRLTSIAVPFGERYLLFTDTRSDDTLTDLDLVNSALLGNEIGNTFSHPMRAKCITSVGNRLVMANFVSWPYITMELVDTTSRIDTTALQGKRFLLRKDDTDTGTQVAGFGSSRLGLELTATGAATINPTTDISANVGETRITASNSLVVGDWVYFFHSAVEDGNRLNFAGYYQVTSASSSAFTVDCAFVTPTANDVDRYIAAVQPGYIPVWLGTDGNFANYNGNVASGLGVQNVAVRRMAIAINAAMAKQTNPWVIANAGGEYRYGELSLDFSKVMPTTPELVLPTFSDFSIFGNEVQRDSEASISAVTQLFPSRVLVSMPNYPEMFDAPLVALDSQSLSAIDVDKENGQEVNALIPFFGDSAFGGSQKDGVVLVGKSGGWYLVNIAAKVQGANAVQKLNTNQGVDSPYSVAKVENSVFYRNQSGVYKIRTDLSVAQIGRRLQRLFAKRIDKSNPELAFGHYSTLENRYKLSIPFTEDGTDYPSRTLVYNTTREYAADGYRDGSWTTYSNVPSIGFCNTSENSYFASPHGEVFALRQANDATDYRDDGEAVTASATLRAVDFGDAAIRKTVGFVVLQFRTEIDSEGTTLSSAVDTKKVFRECDAFTLSKRDAESIERKAQTLKFTLPERKGTYFQLKLENGTVDEDAELISVSFRVSGLNDRGVPEAADSSQV